MNNQDLDKLLELIDKLVNLKGEIWQSKQRLLLSRCSDTDRTNVTEFAGWFS